MSTMPEIRRAIESVLEHLDAKALNALLVAPIEPAEAEEFLVRVFHHCAPSYLPFATDDSGTFVIHLRPMRELFASPILYIPHDEQDAQFLCSCFAKLPSALWLWASAFLSQQTDRLRIGVETLTATIPNAEAVPKELWSFLDADPVRWSFQKQAVNQAWAVANVGHPFAGMPTISVFDSPEDALNRLQPFLEEEPQSVEALATLISIRAELGLAPENHDVLHVLCSECWRNTGSFFRGLWKTQGTGLADWDTTLKSLHQPSEYLELTSLSLIGDSTDVYTGASVTGAEKLEQVAMNFRINENYVTELNQLRNAAALRLMTEGECPVQLSEQITEACEHIQKNSLAAALAQVHCQLSHCSP